MDKYQCGVCGHIYDPIVGEPLLAIVGGVDFLEISDDFKCPICGAEKNLFKPI